MRYVSSAELDRRMIQKGKPLRQWLVPAFLSPPTPIKISVETQVDGTFSFGQVVLAGFGKDYLRFFAYPDRVGTYDASVPL